MLVGGSTEGKEVPWSFSCSVACDTSGSPLLCQTTRQPMSLTPAHRKCPPARRLSLSHHAPTPPGSTQVSCCPSCLRPSHPAPPTPTPIPHPSPTQVSCRSSCLRPFSHECECAAAHNLSLRPSCPPSPPLHTGVLPPQLSQALSILPDLPTPTPYPSYLRTGVLPPQLSPRVSLLCTLYTCAAASASVASCLSTPHPLPPTPPTSPQVSCRPSCLLPVDAKAEASACTALHDCIMAVRGALSALGGTPPLRLGHHTLYVQLFLANMGHFAAVNNVYCRCGGAGGACEGCGRWLDAPS